MFDKDKLLAEQLKYAVKEGQIDKSQAIKIKNKQIEKQLLVSRQAIIKS